MMEYIKKMNMTWKNTILFSILTGTYTGIIMLFPFLNNTSFQDIGITYEWWVLFAIVIVTKCKNSKEALLKCFVFFLISQPLIYLIEVIFNKISLSKAIYYYKTIWLPITFLTIPGGFIAYFSKKQNLLGSIILGLGNTIIFIMGLYYLITTIVNFPFHLLSSIFCFIEIILITINIQNSKKYRIISFIIPIILSAIIVIAIKSLGLYIVSNIF